MLVLAELHLIAVQHEVVIPVCVGGEILLISTFCTCGNGDGAAGGERFLRGYTDGRAGAQMSIANGDGRVGLG